MTFSQTQETIDAVQERSDFFHRMVSEQMEVLFPTVVAKGLTTMEEFHALDIQSNDIVLCYEGKDGTGPLNSAWILFSASGKCLLVGGQETEDIEWFLRFGAIDIIRK